MSCQQVALWWRFNLSSFRSSYYNTLPQPHQKRKLVLQPWKIALSEECVNNRYACSPMLTDVVSTYFVYISTQKLHRRDAGSFLLYTLSVVKQHSMQVNCCVANKRGRTHQHLETNCYCLRPILIFFFISLLKNESPFKQFLPQQTGGLGFLFCLQGDRLLFIFLFISLNQQFLRIFF